MPGLLVFHSLSEALRAGFMVCERTASGYEVRRLGPNGWERAIVDVRVGGS